MKSAPGPQSPYGHGQLATHPGKRSILGKLGRGGLVMSSFAALVIVGIPLATILGSVLQPPSSLWGHLIDTVFPVYLVNTFLLVIIVGVGVAIVGTGTAWLITIYRFPGRDILDVLLAMPLAIPAYVMAYAYTDFLQTPGPFQTSLRQLTGWQVGDYWFPEIRSLGGAALVLILSLYPYVYLLAKSAFVSRSVCAMEAARCLGHNSWDAFFNVALPLARPAIVGGVALALMETLADFGTVQFFGVDTFTTGIYRSWYGMGDRLAASQLSATLLGFVILLLVMERINRRSRRFHAATGTYRAASASWLGDKRAFVAVIACLTPMFLGFILPVLILLFLALDGLGVTVIHRFWSHLGNTVLLAGITAILAVAISLAVTYQARIWPGYLTRLSRRAAGLGYAVPGTVIAVGILIPFTWFDTGIDAYFRSTFGFSTGLILTGSVAALVIAYLVRFLAVAINPLEAGLETIRPSLDDAARALGRGPSSMLVEVHFPLLRGSLMTALLLVFVDVTKELPATLLMRPFNFDTLAVSAYNFASDERLAEAGVPALTIVAIGILPVLLLSRAIGLARPGEPPGSE